MNVMQNITNILRDECWWQRVSKMIYDSWPLEKKIPYYELDESEQEKI